MRPYTPLELAGREIYKREGCVSCHSQMVRALRDEDANRTQVVGTRCDSVLMAPIADDGEACARQPIQGQDKVARVMGAVDDLERIAVPDRPVRQ